MHWNSKQIHVLDFEGTRRSGVIEFGVVSLIEGTLASVHTGMCKPRQSLATEDVRIHGIFNEMIDGEEPFESSWNLFTKLRASGTLAAHHASVEDNLLKLTWAYPRFSQNSTGFGWGPWIDTCRIYSTLYKGLASYSLGSLIETFALEDILTEWSISHCPPTRRKAHCALYDALASALLLLRLNDMPELDKVPLGWLTEISAPNRKRRDELRQGNLFSS